MAYVKTELPLAANLTAPAEFTAAETSMSPALGELRQKAAALRAELQSVEAAIEAYEQAEAAQNGMLKQNDMMMHHRPSYSLFNGPDQSDTGTLRTLGVQDQDWNAVLNNHPRLEIAPIGAFNHWDRRECAVANPQEWRDRCTKYMKDIGGTAHIPKVIHQIWVGPREPPCLWIDTFRSDYLEKYPEWKFEMWSDEQVAKLPMLNEEIYYNEKMWQCKADILRLEFLWHHGGMYVDADMISVGNKCLDPIIEIGKETGFVIAYEPDTKDKPYSILGNSVIACTAHHPLTLMLILFLKQTYYQKREHIEVFAVTGPVMYTKCLVDSHMPMSIADQELLYPAFHFVPNPDAIDFSRFPQCLMFQFGYTCSGLEGYVKKKNRCKKPKECPFHQKTKLISSFRCLACASDDDLSKQVPISLAYMKDFVDSPGNFPLDDGIALFVIDGEFMQLDGLRQEAQHLVDRWRANSGDVMLLGMEWSTGQQETILFNVPPGGRPQHSSVVGIAVNARNMHFVGPYLKQCITETGFDPTALFNAADRLKLWFAAQKFSGTIEEARVWKSMPMVTKIFQHFANHSPPMNCDNYEMHGNLIKGQQDGRNAFEMIVEPNGGIMFRAWNDDNSPNCEMKTNPSKVEWMKVFFNHQISFEAQDKTLP
jgi:hypothetical protein